MVAAKRFGTGKFPYSRPYEGDFLSIDPVAIGRMQRKFELTDH
jgi:hypothetical protein